MKTLKELYYRLNTAKNFKEKYPQYNPDDKKIHVLFLSACTNESSYYRMILPALELNRLDTHSAIISGIHKWDFNKMFDDYDNPVDYRLVQWADYVVMPVLFTRYANLLSHFTYEEITQIKKNQSERVRIGVILDASQANDLKTIEKPLTVLAEKYKDKIELVLFGWSKKIAEQHEALKDLKITYEKPVPFQEYHTLPFLRWYKALSLVPNSSSSE